MTTPRRLAFIVTVTVCVMVGGLALVPPLLWPIPPGPKQPPTLVDHLDAITGPNAVDCGQLEPGATAAEMQAGLDCGVTAMRSGRAFRLIKSDYGIDSWIPHGLVKARTGPLLRFTYDDSFNQDEFATRWCTWAVVTTEHYEVVPGVPRSIRRFTCAK